MYFRFLLKTNLIEQFRKDTQIKIIMLLAFITTILLAWDGPFFSDDCVYTYWTTKQILSGELHYSPQISYQGLGYSIVATPFFILADFFAQSPKMGMRLTNIFFFPFTIWFTYKIGNSICDKKVGILGALLFGFGTFAIEYAIKAMMHISSTLFILAALYIVVTSKEKLDAKNALLAGITSIYAFLIRFDAFILFLIIPAYWFFSEYFRGYELKKTKFHKIGFYFLPLIAVIVILSVFLQDLFVFMLKRAIDLVIYTADRSPISEITRLDGGNSFWLVFIDHSGVLFPNHLSFKYKSSLIQTSPFLVLSIFGFVYLFKKKRSETVFLLSFVLLTTLFYYFIAATPGGLLFIVGGYAFNPRYLMSLLPILSIACAVTLNNWYKHFNLSILVGVLITGLIISFYNISLWKDVINYSRILYFLDRTPINALNLFLAFAILFFSGCYILLNALQLHPFDSIAKDLTIGITCVSFLTSIVNNVILNCLGAPILYYGYPRRYPDGSILRINGPSAGARILPILDGGFYLLGIDLPGKGFLYTYRGGITAVPLFYWLLFFVPFFLIIIFLYSINSRFAILAKYAYTTKIQLHSDLVTLFLFFQRTLRRTFIAFIDIKNRKRDV